MNKILVLPLILLVFLAGCAQKQQPIAHPETSGETAPGGTTPTETGTTTPLPTKRYSLDVDENGFYPTNRIVIPRGEIAQITFFVMPDVNPVGLKIVSDYFNTGIILPGQSKYVQFTTENSFNFTSYLSSTNIAKASGEVRVV